MPLVTLADIEAREFVYCSVTFKDPLEWCKVLVPYMSSRNARELAKRLAEDHFGREALGETHAYPRTYVREARALHALGGITRKTTAGPLHGR